MSAGGMARSEGIPTTRGAQRGVLFAKFADDKIRRWVRNQLSSNLVITIAAPCNFQNSNRAASGKMAGIPLNIPCSLEQLLKENTRLQEEIKSNRLQARLRKGLMLQHAL
jgi:hypothetical protein